MEEDKEIQQTLFRLKFKIEELEEVISDQRGVINNYISILDLQKKNFLRCARDLKHTACDIICVRSEDDWKYSFARDMSDRASMWMDIANSPDGYHSELVGEINAFKSELEKCQDKNLEYRKYFRDHEIENSIEPLDDDVPF